MDTTASYWGLFFSAFISSTLMPGGSEVVLAVLANDQLADASLLLIIATVGNTLGGLTSYALGRLIARRWPLRLASHARHQQAVARLQRYGSSLLLLSWLPLIGDPLCVAAGWLRLRFWPVLLFIAVGKGARYAVVVWLAHG